ncbi:MAG: oxidoreductase [Planctomycetaceae bacterium]|nr:oxidoreductase [Planctomycetaceae bacterium]
MGLIRVGIVGLGANCHLRHVPGLRACQDVEITAVCNRRPESTQQVADQYGIPKTYDRWQDLVADPDLDAVLVGTWPYLHAPISVAALESGKHVSTEARMARDADEAHQMLAASRQHPDLVAQIVPSPFGLRVHRTLLDHLQQGYLGDLREVVVLATSGDYADPAAPLHWRQSADISGLNMLVMGIVHETLIRWVPDPLRVMAQTQIFTTQRTNEQTGQLEEVGTPDTVHVLTELPDGVRGIYHLSGVIHHGPALQIRLFGTEGTLQCVCDPEDRLWGARAGDSQLAEISIAPENEGGWRVEADFIDAIRGEIEIEFTNFAAGVRYMEFTEAVARSSQQKTAVGLPLDR